MGVYKQSNAHTSRTSEEDALLVLRHQVQNVLLLFTEEDLVDGVLLFLLDSFLHVLICAKVRLRLSFVGLPKSLLLLLQRALGRIPRIL